MEQAKPVVLTKPVRGREMLSKKGPLEKVAPGGAVEAEKVDKKRVETYYEGYVDGQLFLVPDSNLEAMKDMINFKMRPKTSIRYKHQTSYDIQYYDQFTEKLNELLAKIDDFQEFAEPDPKESLDRESTEESIVEEKEEVPEEMPEEEEQVGMAEEEKEEIPEEEKEEIPEEVEEEKPVEEEIPEEVEQEKSEEEKEEIPEEAEEEKPEEEEIPEEVEQEKPEEEKEEIPEEAEEEKPEEEEIPEEVQEEKPEEEEIPEEVEQENPEEEKEEIPKEPSAGVVSEDKKSVSKVKSSSAGIESVKSKIETLKSTIMEELKNEYVPESICSVTSSEHSQAEPQKTAKSKEDAGNELRFRFLISGHFKDGQSPTYMVHEYEEKYDTIFKEQKLDFSSIEENDNANVFISGKLYTENILVGSKGDMFFNTKPEKILINKEKSKVFKNSFEQTFEKEDYCIMLRGKSMKQKNSKITPIISLGMQKKSQRNGEPQPKTK